MGLLLFETLYTLFAMHILHRSLHLPHILETDYSRQESIRSRVFPDPKPSLIILKLEFKAVRSSAGQHICKRASLFFSIIASDTAAQQDTQDLITIRRGVLWARINARDNHGQYVEVLRTDKLSVVVVILSTYSLAVPRHTATLKEEVRAIGGRLGWNRLFKRWRICAVLRQRSNRREPIKTNCDKLLLMPFLAWSVQNQGSIGPMTPGGKGKLAGDWRFARSIQIPASAKG